MKKTSNTLLILVIIFLTCPKLLAGTYYVGTTGTPSGNYFTDIQSAIDAASAGDLVIVSNGIYNSGERVTPGYALSNRVVITKNVTVRSVNGPENTIIFGKEGIGGGINTGAVRCVFMTAGAVEGFTLSNGYTLASGDAYYELSGGGVWLTNGCIVTNCIISGNRANWGGGAECNYGGSLNSCTISGNSADKYGGGAYCSSDSSLNGCTISGNNADEYGGGAHCSSDSSLNGCTISGNSAGWNGGGVRCFSGGSLNGCTIIGNSADNGGGVQCAYGASVFDCTISGNSANSRGGGAYYNSGGSLNSCTISGNSAHDYGGGAYINYSGAISACNINGNSANDGGGVYYYHGGSISDCIISGNLANRDGGGAYCFEGGALTNCLIYNVNFATFGGGVYLKIGGDIYNCIITGNNALKYAGGICSSNGGTVINTIIYDNNAILGNSNWRNYDSGAIFSYCCTTPTNNLPVGTFCTSENPMFDAPGSDYHLQNGSPCIDAGFNMPWMTGATDLDGNPRIHDGKVDMGCYEFIPEPGIIMTMSLFIICALRLLRNRH